MTNVPPKGLSQEDYLEKMKAARKSPAVLKSRLVVTRGQLPNCIIFAFEGDNDKPVYYQWVKQIRPDLSYEPFVCGGKKQVFQLRDLLARDLGGLANRVYYFVDRDFDDFAGFQPNQLTFMTEHYSVENYLVTAQVLDELLKDEFHCHAEPALRSQVIAKFEERLEEFLAATKEINRRLFVARKLKLQLLKNLPDRINNIATVDLSKVSGAKEAKEVVVLAEEPSDADIEGLSVEFEQFVPSHRYRGKFSYLFFMKWLEMLCLDRKEQDSICFAQIGQPRTVPIQGMTLGMLASKSGYPAGLREFLGAVN